MGLSKEDFFNETMTVISQADIDAVTVRRIAYGIGVSEAAMYRHFNGVDTLLDETFKYAERKLWHIFSESLFRYGFSDLSFESVLANAWQDTLASLADLPSLATSSLRLYLSRRYEPLRDQSAVTSDEFLAVRKVIESKMGPSSTGSLVACETTMKTCLILSQDLIANRIKRDDEITGQLGKHLATIFTSIYKAG